MYLPKNIEKASFFYVDAHLRPAADEWGSLAACSWGLRRAMDYFVDDADIEENKMVVFGHSRLGKTSLWAGAPDQRLAAMAESVWSNDAQKDYADFLSRLKPHLKQYKDAGLYYFNSFDFDEHPEPTMKK